MGTVIYGTGGMGREALAWVRDADANATVMAFLDDDTSLVGRHVAGLEVVGDVEWASGRDVDVVVALGSPQARRDVVERVREAGLQLRTVVHPTAYVGPRVQIGEGTIVCPHATLTVDIVLDEAVIVNYGARLGHDCRVGSYAFIAPGVHLGGDVTVEQGADVGIGASAIQGVTIGAWSRVGAGAAVVRDVPSGEMVVGIPARPIEREPHQ